MIELNKALKYLDYFSIITVSSNKVPNFPWKEYQSKKIDKLKFSQQYSYKGGLLRKDNTEIPATENFGIVCGFEDLEVIDVDLKVFSTAQEQREFWDEYYNLLKDNILDFEDKFSVYKTKSGGYHILYKTKRVEGNLKLAKLKGHKQAVIETRGEGGYVFTYPENHFDGKEYFDIQYISDTDREVLMYISKGYNFIDPEMTIEPKVINKDYQNEGITPWQDYNNKHSIFDVIGDEFKVLHCNSSKYYQIKRHGGDSAHSGYVFKDSGCMYLFSTATRYPHEKLISPFSAYVIKYHNGDFSAAASRLYSEGYGDRVKKVVKELSKEVAKISVEVPKKDLEFPIDIFDEEFQKYILECNSKLDANIDFMGVSLIWAISVIIGNSVKVEVKKGWVEPCSVWIAVVGRAGLGKTPSINNIIYPLQRINSKEIKEFIKKNAEYQEYQALSKKEKAQVEEVTKPKKRQFIANDITLEALVDLHQDSDNSVGVFKDELAGWFKDMNKYRQGSDLEHWLSSWSGKPINLNRITRAGSFVEAPFIPVLGGIQPGIFNNFYTEENKDNGFLDRMLLSFPEAKVDEYNDNELDETLLNWYKEAIIYIYDSIKSILRRNIEDDNIEPYIASFSREAKVEWKRIFNEFTTFQNNDEENEYLKSMYPKQKSYIPRFALILNTMHSIYSKQELSREISRDSILKAEKLSKYFIANAKKIKIDAVEVQEMKQTTKKAESTYDKIKVLYENDPEFNKTKVAEMLGLSRQQVIRTVKKIQEDGK